MFICILLQVASEPDLVERSYLYITIISSLAILIIGFWRIAASTEKRFNGKVGKAEMGEELGKKANQEDFTRVRTDLKEHIDRHREEYAHLSSKVNDRISEMVKRQDEINSDIFRRMDRSSQDQKEINKSILEKLDKLIPVVTRIDTTLGIVMKDYNNEQNEISKRGY